MATDRHALLVATGKYEDPALSRLRAPAGDARALAKVLADPSIGDFDVRDPLIDHPIEAINQEIEGFFEEVRPEDLLLLYISGHGVRGKDGKLYFATRNTKMNRLTSTALDQDFVNGRMKHSRARSIVLLLDCCHSGAFLKGKSKGSVDAEHRFEGEGRIILTASDAWEYAFEAEDASEQRPTADMLVGSVFTSN